MAWLGVLVEFVYYISLFWILYWSREKLEFKDSKKSSLALV